MTTTCSHAKEVFKYSLSWKVSLIEWNNFFKKEDWSGVGGLISGVTGIPFVVAVCEVPDSAWSTTELGLIVMESLDNGDRWQE